MSSIVALGLGLVLTPTLARLGRRVGLVDRVSGDALKIHAEAKPVTGGIAVVAATLVALAVAGEGVEPLVAASIVMLLVTGVVDDVVTLAPPVRLGAEVAAGGLLAAAGVTFAPLGDLGALAVVLAVPAVANSVNIVDGQDGLAGGLAAVAALGMWLALTANTDGESLGPALVASLLAFLVWNRPPASVFLGDGGAYGVGGLLVVIAADSSNSWQGLLAAIACLGVFGLELGSTMVRRAFSRTSLVSGDREHVYDLLAERLGSRERATAGIVAAGIVAAGVGWFASQLSTPSGVALVAGALVSGSVAVGAFWRSQGVRLRRSR